MVAKQNLASAKIKKWGFLLQNLVYRVFKTEGEPPAGQNFSGLLFERPIAMRRRDHG
jgi:hypothetical protein